TENLKHEVEQLGPTKEFNKTASLGRAGLRAGAGRPQPRPALVTHAAAAAAAAPSQHQAIAS
ncbi:hypothetical protein JYU34_002764, partial [Plutella xylostella]